MKDLKVNRNSRYFTDIIFYVDEIEKRVTFETVENEEKLAQSLVKLFLTPVESHIFGYGVDHRAFDTAEIQRALDLYSKVSKTTNIREQISHAVIESFNNSYTVNITTKNSETITLKLGE